MTKLSSERGATLILVAGASLVLLAFTTFVVDYGVLWVSRRQAQNAADAGAMAGATTLLYDLEAYGATNTNDPTLEGPARAIAIYLATQNFVFGQSPDVQPTDVTFPPCPPGSPGGKCIRVDVFRNQNRGNSLPMWFGQLVGLSVQGVRATATAVAGQDPFTLVLDEDAIDNGSPPNFFTDVEVNDQIAALGLRDPLPYFEEHIGDQIYLGAGQEGDPGWFTLPYIPESWNQAGPTNDGALNFWYAGPGLGNGEELLDKIAEVNALDETELRGLINHSVCAVVPDGDVSMNYNPTTGNLQGNSIGVVAFKVLDVDPPTGTSVYPYVKIEIQSTAGCPGQIGQSNGKVRLVR